MVSFCSVALIPYTLNWIFCVEIKQFYWKQDIFLKGSLYCFLFSFIHQAEDQNVRVCGQVKVNRLPLLTDDLDLCANVTNSLRVNSSSEGEDGIVSSNVYVPYPEEGMWQLALRLECYNATNSRFVLYWKDANVYFK